jgi:hypothetical protein
MSVAATENREAHAQRSCLDVEDGHTFHNPRSRAGASEHEKQSSSIGEVSERVAAERIP